MAGRGRRGIAAGLALLLGRAAAKRARAGQRAGEDTPSTPPADPVRGGDDEPPAADDAELARLRGELADELARRAERG
jgi:hypothetical protein